MWSDGSLPAAGVMAPPHHVQVVVTQLCARVPGGTGRYVEELVRALRLSVPAGTDLGALAPARCEAAERLGVPLTRVRLPLAVLARLWDRGLPPTVRSRSVVHAPTLMVPTVGRRSTLVVTVHDVVPWTHPETLTPRGVGFHRRMGERAAREASVIVTPTEAVAAAVRRHLEPRGTVVAVPSGVRVPPPPADADARRQRLGSSLGPYLLFVGTAEPRKGLDTLVAALARPELSAYRLVVVGPQGWGGVTVTDLAARAGVGSRVVVTGRLDEADLASMYAGARVVAMPSRAEGFGFPVVEAMAHGVPVVVSDDAALVEVAGGAALVAPAGDDGAWAAALADAAEAGPERRQRVAAGRLRASGFTWERTAEQMWSVYESARTRAF